MPGTLFLGARHPVLPRNTTFAISYINSSEQSFGGNRIGFASDQDEKKRQRIRDPLPLLLAISSTFATRQRPALFTPAFSLSHARVSAPWTVSLFRSALLAIYLVPLIGQVTMRSDSFKTCTVPQEPPLLGTKYQKKPLRLHSFSLRN